MPESFACAVAGATISKTVMISPQAFIDFDGNALDGIEFDGLSMDASRRLSTDLYAYSLVCPHARKGLRRFMAKRTFGHK